jgi:hypothetical protein
MQTLSRANSMAYCDPNFDVSALTEDQRRTLLAILYRQECRAWLLLALLATSSFCLAGSFVAQAQAGFAWSMRLAAVVYAIYLTFWVINPSQRVLAQLRKGIDNKDTSLASAYENSFASVWDFIPPLIVPVLLYMLMEFGRIASSDSFFGKLQPGRKLIQREITPELAPWGEYEGYRFIGSYENSSGASFDLYFNENVACKGSIQVKGKIVNHEFNNCIEPGQAKCAYAARQLFAKEIECVK